MRHLSMLLLIPASYAAMPCEPAEAKKSTASRPWTVPNLITPLVFLTAAGGALSQHTEMT